MDLFRGLREQQALEHVRLDPSHVKIWEGNARSQEGLNSTNCWDLTQSIARERGNQVPVIVRPVAGDRLYFELIAGTRRHWAVSYLQMNGHPEIQLLAQVMRLTDEEAFRISDAENSARADVSAVERARNCAWALDKVYGGKQASLAEGLNKSTSWVSKMLAIATIPDEVLSAFRSPADLDFKPAYNLAKALADEEQRPRILEKAREVADDQVARRDGEPMPGKQVLARLLGSDDVPLDKVIDAWCKPDGQAYLTLKRKDAQGLHFLVPAGTRASIWDVKEAFEEALKRHR